jgi:hypothetical protein
MILENDSFILFKNFSSIFFFILISFISVFFRVFLMKSLTLLFLYFFLNLLSLFFLLTFGFLHYSLSSLMYKTVLYSLYRKALTKNTQEKSKK